MIDSVYRKDENYYPTVFFLKNIMHSDNSNDSNDSNEGNSNEETNLKSKQIVRNRKMQASYFPFFRLRTLPPVI